MCRKNTKVYWAATRDMWTLLQLSTWPSKRTRDLFVEMCNFNGKCNAIALRRSEVDKLRKLKVFTKREIAEATTKYWMGGV